MTSFELKRLRLDAEAIIDWARQSRRHTNWPVVYTLNDHSELYVGESTKGASRLRQHFASPLKRHLEQVQVIVDETFNKSACLDLESFLIRMFAGDGKYRVLNGNDGITDSDYFARDNYTKTFEKVFEELRAKGYFTRSIPEIENSDFFKLSPFKALTQDQAAAVEDILEGLFEDLDHGLSSTIVVQGNPGTGKTVLAIYLLKLLSDIQRHTYDERVEQDSMFSDFFVPGYPELLTDFNVGIVIPQQSLRVSVQKVFARIPGLDRTEVLTPFDVGETSKTYDLLIVDEAHRLSRRAAQAMGTQTKQFKEINERLFGPSGTNKSQLDWIIHQSKHQLFLVDPDQTVRPSDVSERDLVALQKNAQNQARFYRLMTQMRVRAESDYVGYIKELLAGLIPHPQDFGEYDLRLFDDFDEMRAEIFKREKEFGLSRIIAGYAWKWNSRKDKRAHDIALGSHKLQWNTKQVDWVNSPTAIDEVGSIHTTQGYDLNYPGVIIGADLVFDAERGQTVFNRSRYFDARGKANNRILGITFTDEDIVEYVRNIYSVLMTRGIRGTYIYVEDELLRKRFRDALQALPTFP